MPNVVTWFRVDLRLADNPAVQSALNSVESGTWWPIYIHAPHEEGEWRPGAASDWWLHHSLRALSDDIAARGSRLQIFVGSSGDILQSLCARHDIDAVHWNRRYEPDIIERDSTIKASLKADGVAAVSHAGALLSEPWTHATAAGDPYRVFTPYWKKARADLQFDQLEEPPGRLPEATNDEDSVTLESLALLPAIDWDAQFPDHWTPGEAGAREAMEVFCDGAMQAYRKGRDIPSRVGTSRLSPHLHFGEISPRRAGRMALDAAEERPAAAAGAEAFVRELGWREFSYVLLYHFPHTVDQPLNERFDAFPWRRSSRDLRAWQRGRTGIPIVDAGMRELWATGWMHNRVRMLVASFLTKNLRLHWLQGARWFWDTLVDADLANNTQGWQWTAGSGADAAPYFRIFNPVLQGKKFDAEGNYVKRWVPELAGLPARWIHEPWSAPDETLSDAGVELGQTYPRPIVDLSESRREALAAYQEIK